MPMNIAKSRLVKIFLKYLNEINLHPLLFRLA